MTSFLEITLSNTLTQKGIEAWANWLGVSATALDRRLVTNPSFHADFRRLGELLYYPPTENFRGDADLYQRPRADLIFRSLSERAATQPRPFWPKNEPYVV